MHVDYKLDVPATPERPALLNALDTWVGIRPPSPLFVHARMLTLVFSRHDQLLVSLDAYIGSGLAAIDCVEVPAVRGSGQLRLNISAAPEEEVRLGISDGWRCRYDNTRRCLHFAFPRAATDPTYYRIASTLAIGLRDGELSDIYIEELREP